MTVVANGNNDVGKETATSRTGRPQMAGAMSQQGSTVMGDNECAQQTLVRLVGYRDPVACANAVRRRNRALQFGENKS
jgi:hypothetical protein